MGAAACFQGKCALMGQSKVTLVSVGGPVSLGFRLPVSPWMPCDASLAVTGNQAQEMGKFLPVSTEMAGGGPRTVRTSGAQHRHAHESLADHSFPLCQAGLQGLLLTAGLMTQGQSAG